MKETSFWLGQALKGKNPVYHDQRFEAASIAYHMHHPAVDDWRRNELQPVLNQVAAKKRKAVTRTTLEKKTGTRITERVE